MHLTISVATAVDTVRRGIDNTYMRGSKEDFDNAPSVFLVVYI